MSRVRRFLLLAGTCLFVFGLSAPLSTRADEYDPSQVPGVVIDHSPASSGIYLGSAGIAVLPDGAFLAKCDEFGPKSTEHERAATRVHRSDDRGRTWRRVARIEGLFWANIFTHRGAAYLLGTYKHHGRVVIMRSDDGGHTWTKPTDEEHGLLTTTGEYHTAPMPMLRHNGRLWRAFEDAMGGTRWGERYRAGVMSAPLDADLLKQSSWTFTNTLARDTSWLIGGFDGWLEGNAVLTPEGQVVDILRVATSMGGKAAIVRISGDGTKATFDPKEDLIDFPGGSKKFLIRYDERTGAYWALANPVLPKHAHEKKAASIRNTLALLRSTDLRSWEIRCVLIYHPDVWEHGFQYPDWLFDGDDMIAAVRTAYDDGLGGGHNAHDANFLTFHRFADFRNLTLEDSVIDPEWLKPAPKTRCETSALVVEGTGFTVAAFGNDEIAYNNRKYVWKDVPAEYEGWRITRKGGAEKPQIAVRALAKTTVLIATAAYNVDELSDWEDTGEQFVYTDHRPTEMRVLRREFSEGETLTVPQLGWTGTMLLLPAE